MGTSRKASGGKMEPSGGSSARRRSSAIGPAIRVAPRRTSSQSGTDAATYFKNLSPFQVEKFSYLFDAIFDLEKNGLIESADIVALADKMRDYCGWSKDSPEYKRVLDVQYIFLECLQDQVRSEMEHSADDDVIPEWSSALKSDAVAVTSVTKLQWLNMWGRLVYGVAGMASFPIWVQVLPELFFTVMDLDKDGVVSVEEYTKYCKDFVGITDPKELEKVVKEGYRALTAGGDYKLNRENYNFCFANFMLGRSIYGPGKYIFGVFDNRDLNERFQVLYNDDEDDMET